MTTRRPLNKPIKLEQYDLSDEPEIQENEKEEEIVEETKFKSKRRKQENASPYHPRRFVTRWLTIPEIRGWIHPLRSDPAHVWCKFCRKKIRAHLSDMKVHTKTRKHQKNMKLVLPELPTEAGMEIDHKEVVISFPSSKLYHEDLIGLIDPSHVMASAPSDRNLTKLRSLGVKTTHDNNEVVKHSDVIFLCVKPHHLTDMIGDLNALERSHNPLFVSIITGFDIKTLEEMLTALIDYPRVIRLMPNTPSMVGQGCCVYTLGSHTPEAYNEVMNSMLSSIGLSAEIPEYQMDAACGLAGSGPAYIYAAIEALADGGVKMGLPRQLAQTLAAQMVKGAATMVLESGKHPGQLKDEVCSPGGTTIAAMHSLEKNGLRNALISAVEASALRSKELGTKK
ncbi:Pyrroline-5-carboxylate reductase 1-like [Homarus americanus]|uniref:pyrroline-5-carboxylate reductase n=1 Tax=Homarus americanus TaxID=6706 RepID=A0A8J5N4H9_HOMAM|nr:Pyrroline-5-carboxylate reductase 1-like [Homarus americanus]